MIDLEHLKNNPEEFRNFFSTFDWSKDSHKIGCIYSGSIAKNIHFGEDVCKNAPVFHKKTDQPRDIDLGVYNEDMNWVFEMMRDQYPNHKYGRKDKDKTKSTSMPGNIFKVCINNIHDVTANVHQIISNLGTSMEEYQARPNPARRLYTNIQTGVNYSTSSLPRSRQNIVEILGFSRIDGYPILKFFEQMPGDSNQDNFTFRPDIPINASIQYIGGIFLRNQMVRHASLADIATWTDEEDIDSYDETAEVVETKNDIEIVKIGEKFITRIVRPVYEYNWFTKSIYKFGCPVSGRNVEIHITSPEKTKNILSYMHGCNVNVTSLYTFIMGSLEWKRPKDIWFLELCRSRISKSIPLPKEEKKSKSNSYDFSKKKYMKDVLKG